MMRRQDDALAYRLSSLFGAAVSLLPPALIAVGLLVYAAHPEGAHSSVSDHLVRPPEMADSVSPALAPIPPGPVQVAMPAAPPMRIYPGLEEALVATGPVSREESRDLDAALALFHDAPAKAGSGSDYSDDARPLLAFITAHPGSRWNAALYTDLGLGYYHAGYYSRAFAMFGRAWSLGRDAASPQAHRMVDRALGELAGMHARVGHLKELEALFADIGSRPIAGPATALLDAASGGMTSFRQEPGISYRCGPMALESVLTALKAGRWQIQVAQAAQSGPHGFSLPQLARLADKAKLRYTLIHREPGQPIPVPSIVNWKVHHYAAILAKDGDYFRIQDPTFGAKVAGAVTQKAFDAETTGYFLVPQSVMAKNLGSGWRTVSVASREAQIVYGMGNAPGPIAGGYMFSGPCIFCGMKELLNKDAAVAPQMTVANAQTMTVDLTLSDTPVGYRPQVGIPALDRLTYHARDDVQPANFSYSNVSGKWTHSWQVAIEGYPSGHYDVRRLASGGGAYNHVTYNDYLPEPDNNSTLARTPPGGFPATSFTRNLPDGGKEVYGLSNNATSFPVMYFLTSSTDAQGNTTTLHYDATFRLTSVVDAMGRSTTFSYGLTGYPLLITRITDPFGRYTQLTYDASERLASITDPIGIVSSFTYSATEPSFISKLTTPYGISTFSDTPNPKDPATTATRSLTLTDPMGYTDYLYFYQSLAGHADMDPAAIFPAMPDILNKYLEYRNSYHWNKHQTASGGATFSGGVPQSEDFSKATLYHFSHYADQLTHYPIVSNQLNMVKAPLENPVWFASYPNNPLGYDSGTLDSPTATGRVLDDGTTQLSQANFPLEPGINPGYDTTYSPYPLSRTDPVGRVTSYAYAANHIDLLSVSQGTGSGSAQLAGFGNYNAQHRPQSYTGADGRAWTLAWNAAGQPTTVTDPAGHTRTRNYDGLGRLASIVNENGKSQVTYTYDAADRIQTETDSEGYRVTYAYDNLDRKTQVTYPDGTADKYSYKYLDMATHTDRMGRVTTYGYDADRRLTSVTEPLSSGGGAGSATRTTRYAYYEDGSLKDIIDASGADTHYEIDIESRPISKTYGYGTSWASKEAYAYEASASRVHSVTDADGQTRTFAYGKDDRVTSITYGNVANPTPNVSFAWDAYFPRMSSMTDGTGTTSFAYAAPGTLGALKLTQLKSPYANASTTLAYDSLGRISSRGVAGGNESFGYDAIGRMTSHTTPLGTFTDVYLGETGQMTSRSVTNGSTTVSTRTGYDTNANDRRLLSIANSGASRDFGFGYNNPYDIASAADTANAGNPFATQSHSYAYDLADRLLTANQATPGNDSYAYDDVDNTTRVATPTVNATASYNALDQILQAAGKAYRYDANGNLLAGEKPQAYKYDAENRLTEIDYVGTSNKSVFTYNGLNQRVADSETVNGVTTTTHYLWCGAGICQTSTSTGTVTRRDLDEGEYNVITGQKLVYQTDQLGSVRDVIDATTGTRVQSYDYTPYGAVTRADGATPTDYQFAGLMYHPQSGLNLATYRAYDSILGRWLNRDPIRENGGINLYRYSANPVIQTDKLGLVPGDKWYGFNDKDFQRWFHRCWKQAGAADADQDEIEEAYTEWRSRGSPQNGDCYKTKPTRGGGQCESSEMISSPLFDPTSQFSPTTDSPPVPNPMPVIPIFPPISPEPIPILER